GTSCRASSRFCAVTVRVARVAGSSLPAGCCAMATQGVPSRPTMATDKRERRDKRRAMLLLPEDGAFDIGLACCAGWPMTGRRPRRERSIVVKGKRFAAQHVLIGRKKPDHAT